MYIPTFYDICVTIIIYYSPLVVLSLLNIDLDTLKFFK